MTDPSDLLDVKRSRRDIFGLAIKTAKVAGGVALAGAGLEALTGCMPVDAKAGDTPPAGTAPAATDKSPETGKSPEAGTLPTLEQWAAFTPEQATQTVQDYLSAAKTPAEYTQRRVNLMNLMMQVGSTKAEVEENFLATGKDAGTYLAYVNEKYIVPHYRGTEVAGESNEANVIAWYEKFFAAPKLRYAISRAMGYSVPYEAKATIGETSVTKGDATSSATPFSVSFGLKVTDNFAESKVNTMRPSGEKALALDCSFVSDVIPVKKDGKTLLSSTGEVITVL